MDPQRYQERSGIQLASGHRHCQSQEIVACHGGQGLLHKDYIEQFLRVHQIDVFNLPFQGAPRLQSPEVMLRLNVMAFFVTCSWTSKSPAAIASGYAEAADIFGFFVL